jgi:hypothetical protein
MTPAATAIAQPIGPHSDFNPLSSVRHVTIQLEFSMKIKSSRENKNFLQ